MVQGRQQEAWPDQVEVADVHLESAGVVRLVSDAEAGAQVVVAIKAGHNDENHNHNDVGSFVVHAGGETFLCDPGAGLYTRQYFGGERHENAFTNSFGHSVPVVDGALQSAGRSYEGQVTAYVPEGTPKRVVVEMGDAYGVSALRSLRREIAVGRAGAEGGVVTLTDEYAFSTRPASIEEAFVTWLEVEVDGGRATIRGEGGTLRAEIETPAGGTFSLSRLERECMANGKSEVLKRLSVDVPADRNAWFVVRMWYAAQT